MSEEDTKPQNFSNCFVWETCARYPRGRIESADLPSIAKNRPDNYVEASKLFRVRESVFVIKRPCPRVFMPKCQSYIRSCWRSWTMLDYPMLHLFTVADRFQIENL